MLKRDKSEPLARESNPLLERSLETFDVADLESPVVLARPAARLKRELRDLRRKQSAEEAIRGLAKGIEIYGFTKGQFSLLELLQAVIKSTGPVNVSLSTWTAARHEIGELARMRDCGELLGLRWLVDFTFARRDPEAAHSIRMLFGLETIRVAQNHAKFCIFTNAEWQLVLRTSMNLNMNPRFEDFTIAHDPELAAFIGTILDEIWNRQTRALADATPKEARRFFTDEM